MNVDTQHRDSAYARSVVPRGDAGWDTATLTAYARAFAEAYGDPPTTAWMHPTTRAALEMHQRFLWSDVIGDDTAGECAIIDDPGYREDIVILNR